MVYIELDVKINPENPLMEILMVELGEIGFESFVDTETGMLAYIQKQDFNEDKIKDIQIIKENPSLFSYIFQQMEDKNWNEVWESNYEPVIIAGRCGIRAPFHPENNDVEFDLVIEPKMSFGTAHHETTSMMIELLLSENIKGKTTLDMGCGTSVLAILAAKLGAVNIMAIDNDEWAYNNSLENILKNNEPHIKVLLGDAQQLDGLNFDVIIANINRNILLNDIHTYAAALNTNGVLMMSGFYENDIDVIKSECTKYNLCFDRFISKNNWAAVRFYK
ncbi:MAG: 50S ribosomal protein L11 methyltransferase [Bacteroidetes bacterium]|nr:50S ribosomal protein L11 methyltransferase [Bacteroidota bacterium]